VDAGADAPEWVRVCALYTDVLEGFPKTELEELLYFTTMDLCKTPTTSLQEAKRLISSLAALAVAYSASGPFGV